MGRMFAIGDIHGCDVALATLLDAIAPTGDDTLIFLGDYVNRGSNSRLVLDILMKLSSVCQCVFIMGNHELMMLDGLYHKSGFELWLRVGGDRTLQSFGLLPYFEECHKLPYNYIEFIKKTIDYYEIADFIFCHASLYSHLPLSKQDDYALRWRKLEYGHLPHISGKTIICGHTAQKNGQILLLNGGKTICIDTWAYGGGCLSALQIKDKVSDVLGIYQANNTAQLSISHIYVR